MHHPMKYMKILDNQLKWIIQNLNFWLNAASLHHPR